MRGAATLVLGIGAVVCTSSGCNALWGLDDLDYSGSTASGSTSTGSGAAGAGAATTSSAGAGGAAQGGGGQGGAPCYAPGLVDGFDAASIDDSRWQILAQDATVDVSDGRLVVAVGESSLARGILRSVESYDLRECSVWLEVPRVPPANATADTFLSLWGSVDSAYVSVTQGTIRFDAQGVGGTSATERAYDAEAHRWWRLRGQQNALLFETSPDGQHWTMAHQVPAPPYLANAAVEIGASSWQAVDPAVSAEFDNVNTVP